MAQRSYTEEEIDHGLATLALVVSAEKASKATGIPKTTLESWRARKHATRYEEIRAEMLPRIREDMARQAEDSALRQGQVAAEMLEHLATKIGELSADKAAKALQSLEIAKGINIDKAQLLRGQPTQIVEKRDADEIVRSIAQRFPELIVDSTAVELPSAAELPAGAA